jgi:ferredoxin-NADP reductase
MSKRTGMTARLYDKAKASPTGIITMWGAVEGPYGGHDSLDSYGTVVLFAGGVGITHQLSYVKHLIEGNAAGTVATRKIILVWSVRTTETLEWIRPWMDQILAMPNRRQILKILLFVTKPRSAREVVSRSETVLMYPGRANPKVILEKEMKTRVGAMAVTVCGPGAFADDVRAAARGQIEEGTVDFVEESFTW